MALIKSKDLETGVQGNYYRVINLSIDWLNNQATIIVALYVSEEARRTGKIPLDLESYYFSQSEFPFTIAELESEGIFSLSYSKLKSLPQFEGAQDA